MFLRLPTSFLPNEDQGYMFVQVQTPAGAVPAMLPPGSWQHGEPSMDAVPALGQHTDAILSRYGYSAQAIAALREQGVV